MFKLFFFTLRRNQIKVQMKRVLFTLIGLILLSLGTAETASAQRTATGKAFIGVNQFVSGYAIPSGGLGIEGGQYLVNSYWKAGVRAVDWNQKVADVLDEDGDRVWFDHILWNLSGSWMYRVAGSYSRRFNLYIGAGAFKGCWKLEEAVVPEGVTSLLERTFARCRLLERISLPTGLQSIGESCFQHCGALEEIDLPDSLESVGQKAFFNCRKLSRIRFGNKLDTIDDEAFASCEMFDEVVLPESVGWVGRRCFKDCVSLFSVALPPHIEFIEEGVFEGCASLDAVVVPNDLSHIESKAFAGTGLAAEDLALPEACQIAEDAFD